MHCKLLNCKNYLTTKLPKSHPAPREFFCQVSISYGSDHIKSHKGPLDGISTLRYIDLIRSMVLILGESPPCTQNKAPT